MAQVVGGHALGTSPSAPGLGRRSFFANAGAHCLRNTRVGFNPRSSTSNAGRIDARSSASNLAWIDPKGSASNAAWIDVPICEQIVDKPIKLIVAVDGAETSMAAFAYVTEGFMQRDRNTYVDVIHIYDANQSDLPNCFRRNTIQSFVEVALTGALSSKRYKFQCIPCGTVDKSHHICEEIKDIKADYVCLGFNAKSKSWRSRSRISSMALGVVERGQCSIIVIKDDSVNLLPVRRPAKFVVSVSLNQSSTKAFLDSLRLSRPGDEIHVIYVKSFMEDVESDYTKILRHKYASFFRALQNGDEKVFSKFRDRSIRFHIQTKQAREQTGMSVVRYADDIDADFIVVGANASRGSRGKFPIGTVSRQICLETERNFIVSSWVDLRPDLYERYCR